MFCGGGWLVSLPFKDIDARTNSVTRRGPHPNGGHMSEYAEIRERLYRPPNAVVDRPIALRGAARGISGYEASRLANIATAVREMEASIINALPAAPFIDDDNRPTVRAIQVEVARQWGFMVMDLISARREAEICLPRHIAMALCKRLTLCSLPDIGRRFGDRDHTTALASIRKAKLLMAAIEPTIPKPATLADWVSAAKLAVETMGLSSRKQPRTKLGKFAPRT